MYNTSTATRNLLKYGIVFVLIAYTLYEFVAEYLGANSVGFTPTVFVIGLIILGGGTLFSGFLALRAWRESQAEAAAAIDAQEAINEEDTAG